MSLSNILVPNAGCLLGVYPGSSCDSATSDLTRLHNHETQVNRTATTNGILNIVNAYHDFDDFTSSFAAPSGGEGTMSSEGRILLTHWTPRIFGGTTQFRWPDIAAGTYDAAYVDPTARAMRDYGKKFFLAFHNEMNASSSDAGGTYGTDAEYASAARHIHDRFIAQGATNVVWVFKPSGYTTTISRMNTLYPGDAYVDWIGYDPYVNSGQDATYMIDTKYPMYTWATVTKSGSHTKPLMWAEWGGTEASGPTTKAQFIEQVRTLLPANYPLIKAICWFNSTGGPGDCLNTSAAAVNAYKILAADPYFNPDLAATPPPVNQGAFRAGASKAYSNSANQTLVIPAAVQAGDSMVLFHTCTRAELRNAAEGTNATAVSVANSGSVGSNPADFIAGTAPTYDTTGPLNGTSSMKAAVAGATTSGLRWTTSFTWPNTYRGSLLYSYPSNPAAVCRIYQQAATAPQWGIGIETTGKISVRDLVGGVSRGTQAGAAPATGTKHRIEWQAAWDSVAATTVVTLRLFLGANWNGATPDETITSTAFAQAIAPTSGTFGVHFSAAQTFDVHLDQMVLDANGYPGLPGTSAVLSDPAGWSPFTPQILAAGAAELAGRAYRRVALAGDPGSTITLNTDVNAHGAILLVAYSGTDLITPVDVSASNTKSTDSTTVVTPNVTTTVANDWIESAAFVRDNPGGATTAWTLPGGEAQRAAAVPSGTTDGRVAGVATDDGVSHAIGTYGTKTFTSDRTSYLGIGWTIALKANAATGETQSCGLVGIP